MYGCESWTVKKAECEEFMLLNCGVGEDSWKSLGLQGDPTSPSWKKSVLNIHWKDWCWSWNSNTLATWCKELTHWKGPWCWERLKAGGEEDDRGWDGWMASPIQWTWVCVNSGSWWWTGKSGVLQSIWGWKELDMTEWLNWLNWTEFLTNQLVDRTGFWLIKENSLLHTCVFTLYTSLSTNTKQTTSL